MVDGSDIQISKGAVSMKALKALLACRFFSDLSAAKFAQIACYVGAITVFVFSILKLTTLTLTETELFFGILLVLAVLSSMICGGTLVRIEAEIKKRNDSNSS
jgi:hypothetical protein